MISPLQATLRAAITDTVTRLYGLDAASLPAIAVEVPPRRALGDLAVPLAFELARRLRKAPRAIAQEIVAALPSAGGHQQGGSGAERLHQRLLRSRRVRPAGAGRRRRRPATVGHVRHPARQHDRRAHRHQSEQGGARRAPAQFDARRHVRPPAPLLRRTRRGPELHRRHRRPGRRRGGGIPGAGGQIARRHPDDRRHDALRLLLLGPLREGHRVVCRRQGAPRERLAIRNQALHDIEHGGNASADIATFIADRIVRAHLKTMARMNVDYDLLTWEGDILRLKFWARAFEILRESGAMYLQDSGKLKGCWVMRIDEDLAIGEARGARVMADDRRWRRGRGGERSAITRKSDRAIERRRHLRRQGHRAAVLEDGPARQGFPLPQVRDAHGRRAAVGDDDRSDGGRAAVLRGASGAGASSRTSGPRA